MIRTLLFLAFFYTIRLSAQFSEADMLAPYAFETNDVKAVDMDNDGQPDIVSLSNENSRIAWYNNDEGVFDYQHIILNTNKYNTLSRLHLADLDNDGDVDCITASSIDNQLFWFENDGFGNFSEAKVLQNLTQIPLELAIVDMNGNGQQDLLLLLPIDGGTGNKKQIVLYQNLGANNWTPQKILLSETLTNLMQTADLDADGDQDLLIGTSDNEMYWFEGDGQGNIGKEGKPIENSLHTGHTLSQMIVTDLDQDGYLDIIPHYEYNHQIVWIQNDENTAFSTTILIGEENATGATGKLTVGDLNNDGFKDIVYNGFYFLDSDIRWLENTGMNTFHDFQTLHDIDFELSAIVLTDLNQNGYLDILIGEKDASNLKWYANREMENFDEHTLNTFLTKEDRLHVFEDLDHDGFKDFLDYTNESLYICKNNKTGRFGLPQLMIETPALRSIATADLNSDGNTDIIIGADGEGTLIRWYEGDGNLNWQTRTFDANNDNAEGQYVTTGDLDSDGDEDIIMSTKKGFFWYPNDGTGNFDAPRDIPIQYSFFEKIWVRDVDGDTDLDLLAVGNSNNPRYWTNDGAGNFSEPYTIEATNLYYLTDIDLVDIDTDGDLDLVFINGNEKNIFWCEKQTDPLFLPAIKLLEGEEYSLLNSFEFKDIDKDGDKDLLMIGKHQDLYQSELRWYFNNEGNFSLVTTLDDYYGFWSSAWLEIVDITGDGEEDLLAGMGSYWSPFIYAYNSLIDWHTTISGRVYWDANENGVMDENEVPLSGHPTLLMPNNQTHFSNDLGLFFYYVAAGNYELSSPDNSLWELIHPSTSYSLNLLNEAPTTHYNFGFKPTRTLPRVEPHTNSSPTRCNDISTFWLTYSNTGTTIANGTITLETDELMDFISSNPEPDAIEEGHLTWKITNLPPTQEGKISLQFQMPNEEHIGEILQTQTTVQLSNESEEVIYAKSTEYNSEVRCSYDPNDKLFRSNLLGESESAYISDTLLYTIRFQNTGNDVAFNIRIEDVLDKRLDWTTFHPITASHHYRAELNRETGLVTFHFDDIMLPDSTSNEPESHGFVLFGIASLAELEDKTEVENTASIFFDFNPPIITNTTSTVLIDLYDVSIGDSMLDINYSIFIYPNPFSDYTMIEVEGFSTNGNYRLEVMDILGRKVRTLILEERKARLERGELESGVYFFRVLEEGNLEAIGGGKVLVE